mmetsp:Transcript_21592/g.65983  ORF Transcript_21592/g.65983 Transcript_21592/m.65983 type:complete len:350 (+) Transcript_21592:287-1336(+)
MRLTHTRWPESSWPSSRPCSTPSLTPLMTTYSTMTLSRALPAPESRMKSSTAARISGMVVNLAVGTICWRTASLGACSESASCTLEPARRRIASGRSPTVLTVMRFGARRQYSVMTPTADTTASTLSSGSPIPMNTTFVTSKVSRGAAPLCTAAPAESTILGLGAISSRLSCDASRAACQSCSRISAPPRSARRPIVPVSQNLHPLAQPTCDDTHTVTAPSPCPMSTVSTVSPLRSSTPSLALATSRASFGRAGAGAAPSSRCPALGLGCGFGLMLGFGLGFSSAPAAAMCASGRRTSVTRELLAVNSAARTSAARLGSSGTRVQSGSGSIPSSATPRRPARCSPSMNL